MIPQLYKTIPYYFFGLCSETEVNETCRQTGQNLLQNSGVQKSVIQNKISFAYRFLSCIKQFFIISMDYVAKQVNETCQ